MHAENENIEVVELKNSELTTCVNCHQEVNNNFCANCGQKAIKERLRVKTLFSDFLTAIYGLNGKFPRTVIDLVARPSDVPNEFIQGNRVKYLSPISYYFIVYAILLVIQWILDVNLFEAIKSSSFGESMNEFQQQNQAPEETMQFSERIQQTMQKYQQYVSLISFLIYGLIAKWFYKRSGMNYIENVIVICYAQAQALYFSILLLIIFKITGSFPIFLLWLLSSVYITVVVLKVYGYKKLGWGIVKSFLFLITGNIAVIIIAIFLGAIVGAVAALAGLI